MNELLAGLRGKKYIGVSELATEVSRLLIIFKNFQGDEFFFGANLNLPDERTIRYYLTENLISPAEEKFGTASVFGYLQLLQLLAVKKLQADELPIRSIRKIVEGRTERELEKLIGVEPDNKAETAAQKQSLKNEAQIYLENLLVSSSAPTARLQPNRQTGALNPIPAPIVADANLWERIEIEPGLEIHVAENYALPTDAKKIKNLSRFFENHLEKARQRRAK